MKNRERKKTWQDKVVLVQNALERSTGQQNFASTFYKHLFFLKPSFKEVFKNTDWNNQERLLTFAIEHLSHFLNGNEKDSFHRQQIVRISETHSKKNMNIHPHDYYYWIDAMVLTVKEVDPQWHDDLSYYIRECLFFPISFIISRYHL